MLRCHWQHKTHQYRKSLHVVHRFGQGAIAPPKCLEHIVIFAMRDGIPNKIVVIRRKANILSPPTFWADYATEVA